MTKREHQIGDGPIQEDIRELNVGIATALDHALNGETRPRKIGFVLLTFRFGSTDGRCNYISNGARDEIKVLLREQLARWEGRVHDGGRA